MVTTDDREAGSAVMICRRNRHTRSRNVSESHAHGGTVQADLKSEEWAGALMTPPRGGSRDLGLHAGHRSQRSGGEIHVERYAPDGH